MIWDRRSSTGYCFQIGRRLISWGSQRQLSIALSEMEAQYTKAYCQEIAYLEYEEQHLNYQKCVALTKNLKFHGKTQTHKNSTSFVRERSEEEKIELKFCDTENIYCGRILTMLLG